jgi:exo-beta-1,3-glucanase (GH17 family)
VWHNRRAGVADPELRPLRAALLIPWVAALWLGAAGALVLAAAPTTPRPICHSNRDALPAVERLRAALVQGRFVAYQPTSLKVTDGHVTPADPSSIRADLGVLRPKFDGLITYDAIHGAESIAAIATALKFRALIIGVWNPADETELAAAIEAARRFPQLVLGVSLGNELLFARRSDPAALAALIGGVRARLPGTPLTTTEPFHIYYQPEVRPLLGELDFLLVNVHPVFQPWFRDAPDINAAQFVVNVLAGLAPLACGPIVVKETGVPTAPESKGFSEKRQAAFYAQLRRQLPPAPARAFAYFAAFDAPWRAYDALAVPGAAPAVHPEEAHWGLYDAERRPKQAARELPPLPGY